MSPEISLTQTPANVRHGSNIGQPLTRREGVLKVKGQARYAADNHPPGMLHAVMAVSSIARGRVTFLDVQAAKNHPDVIEVMTPANRPPLAQDPDAKTNPFMFRLDLLQNDKVRYANQPIAVVIAKTLEAATEGAALLAPRYEALPARVGLDADESFVPAAVGVGNPSEMHRGDVKAGLAAASKRIEAIYETPTQYHNAMEPHAIVVAWDGDSLSIDTPSQGLAMAQGRIAGLFGIAPDKIHIRSPYLGGGFGSKGLISGPQILGILAAQLVGQPVKLVLRREHMYGRPPRADPADASHRHRRRWPVDRDRPSRQDGIEQLRRFLRTGRRRLTYAVRQSCDLDLTRGRPGRHRHAAVHACARRGHRFDRARKRHR
jgi:xanthine dehydrogenase YagR molybdenum-binding subunit